MQTRPGIVSVCLLVLLTCGACCPFFGNANEDRIKELKAQVSQLKKQRAVLKAAEKNHQEILAASANTPLAVATISPRDLEKALKGATPFSFPASRLHNLVSGTIRIERISSIKVSSKGVSLTVSGRGQKLKVQGIAGGTSMAKEIIAGLTKGLSMNLTGTVDIDARGDMIFTGKASKVSLKKYGKQHNKRIQNAVNQYALNTPHKIDLTPLTVGSRRLKAQTFGASGGKIVIAFSE